MSLFIRFTFIVLAASSLALGQSRDFRTHTRGMLWETVFNTGEIGRTYDVGISGTLPEYRSWEWPGNSGFRIGSDERYDGFYNAFGGGMWIGADTGRAGNRLFYVSPEGGAVHCGFVTDDDGRTTAVEGVYSYPISIEKITNFPLNADGSVNGSYNPDEAEEIIRAKWDTPIGVTVTRTSRAWSFPDYDDFIIYEYELENTGRRLRAGASHDTLYEMTVAFGYANTPSYVAYQREFGRWHYGDSKNGQMYTRMDLKRWLWYTHTRDGKPDRDYFAQWARTGENGGGLTAPASVGYMMLNYDHDHLAKFRETPTTRFYVNTTAIPGTTNQTDHRYVWDKTLANGITPAADARLKQPWLLRMENSHMPPGRSSWLDGKTARKTSPHIPGRLDLKAQTEQDTSRITRYWFGRANMVVTQAYTQVCAKTSAYGPYVLPPGEKMRFALAEVAGYGAGLETDSIYYDYGGGTGDSPNEGGPYFHPVPSWYSELWYPFLNSNAVQKMGSTYLKNYPLPAYVNSDVISMRQVADRAIQMYKGGPVIKYDTLQYDPVSSPSRGVFEAPVIPCPSPVIRVAGEGPILSRITWGAQVESITRSTAGFARLNAPLKSYKILRSISAIGPWTVLETVSRADGRYFNSAESKYIYDDLTAMLNTIYYYAVVSVDSLAGKSGLTNITRHNAQLTAVRKLGKVYAAPNPFILKSGYSDETDRIGIYGLPAHATIRVYSYSGQLVHTQEHDNANAYATGWLQLSRNNQWIASGIYFFTVDDKTTGDKAWGKFVIIH